MSLEEYKEFWKAHLRPWSGLPIFPRDMATRDTLIRKINGKTIPTPLNRYSCISEKLYLASLSYMYRNREMYIQVFSDWQIEKGIYDTIFLEMDVDTGEKKKNYDLEDIVSDILYNKHIIDSTLDDLDISYRSLFTGGRGFHYYLDFPSVSMYDYKSTVVKFLDDVKLLDIVDKAVLEPARIAKIPYTKHLGTGFNCVYVDVDNVDRLLEISKKNSIVVNPIKELQKTRILDYLDLEVKPKRKKQVDEYTEKYTGIFPECCIRIIEKIQVDQHATHDERKHLAGYLKRFKYSDLEILEFFRNTSDFKYDYALSQIESLAPNSNYSCRNVRLLMKDLCPGTCDYIREVARRNRSEKE